MYKAKQYSKQGTIIRQKQYSKQGTIWGNNNDRNRLSGDTTERMLNGIVDFCPLFHLVGVMSHINVPFFPFFFKYILFESQQVCQFFYNMDFPDNFQPLLLA